MKSKVGTSLLNLFYDNEWEQVYKVCQSYLLYIYKSPQMHSPACWWLVCFGFWWVRESLPIVCGGWRTEGRFPCPDAELHEILGRQQEAHSSKLGKLARRQPALLLCVVMYTLDQGKDPCQLATEASQRLKTIIDQQPHKSTNTALSLKVLASLPAHHMAWIRFSKPFVAFPCSLAGLGWN